MSEFELAGVEKMKELGYAEASMADAMAVYEAMAALDQNRIKPLANTISYVARDNAGQWFELVGGAWVQYIGPGRVLKKRGER